MVSMSLFFKRKDRIMKRAGGRFILSLLFLVLAAQQSYADTNPLIKEMGKRFQAPCPTMIPPPVPGCVERMVGIPGEGLHLPYFQGLNLDDNQKKALGEIENTTLKEMIKKRADKQIAELELHELLDKEPVDLKAVETKLKQIAIIESELQLTVIRSTEKMKAKLTSEQQDTLKKARQMDPGQKPFRQRAPMCDDRPFPPPPAGEETGGWDCPLLPEQGDENQGGVRSFPPCL
jgi:Spy/CpxP family protein refolding chaperone